MDGDGHVAAGTIDLTKYRNITSLPTTRLIPRASILILQQQQQQQQHYRTNLKIDIEHDSSTESHEKGHQNSNAISSSSSVGNVVGGYEKLASVGGLGLSATSAASASSGGVSRLEMGQAAAAASAYEHVDKSIKLSLEPKNHLDPLANAYVSVKNGRGDQKSEMIIVTPSAVAQSHDRGSEMVSRVDFLN